MGGIPGRLARGLLARGEAAGLSARLRAVSVVGLNVAAVLHRQAQAFPLASRCCLWRRRRQPSLPLLTPAAHREERAERKVLKRFKGPRQYL